MEQWKILYQNPEIYGSDASLVLQKVPLWAKVGEALVELVDTASGHRLCGPPEWTYMVPLAPDKDEDGFFTKSLGTLISDSFRSALIFFYCKGTTVSEIPLDKDWLKENDLA